MKLSRLSALVVDGDVRVTSAPRVYSCRTEATLKVKTELQEVLRAMTVVYACIDLLDGTL